MDNLKKPLISVIIPCYNAEKYIEKCILSVLDTQYKDFEVICIDDGSADGTFKVLQSIKANNSDYDIKVFTQINKGVSAARNYGIDLSIGKYITFIDSDDWVEKDYLLSLIEPYKETVGLVFCSYNRVFANTTLPRHINIPEKTSIGMIKRRCIGLYKEELSDPSQSDTIAPVWMKLYIAQVIKDNSIKFISTKELGTSEDLLFNLHYSSCLGSHLEVIYIDKPLYNYHKSNGDSITSTYKTNFFDKWKHLFSIIEKEVSNEEENEAYLNRICLSIIGLGLHETNNPSKKTSIDTLRNILNDPLYKMAYDKLELKYFPFHWKVFFLFAKYRAVYLLYFMLLSIKRIINKN